MSEYTELTAKIEALEKRVKYLEDTFATLADMNKSGEMGQYIVQRQRALVASKLINAVAGTQKLNADAQQQVLDQLAAEKAAMDARIEEAIRVSVQNAPDENDLAQHFIYGVVPDGVEILGINIKNVEGMLRIPEKICGRDVVGIGKEAFKNTDIYKVFLPDTIKYVGRESFSGCRNLTQIDFPNTLERLGIGCFENTGLTEITLPKNLKEVWYRTFLNCKQLKKVALNERLEAIRSEAFSETDISQIIIPSSVQIIEKNAFKRINNGKLEIVVLGMNTEIKAPVSGMVKVYCTDESATQKRSRQNGINARPLSEFKNV